MSHLNTLMRLVLAFSKPGDTERLARTARVLAAINVTKPYRPRKLLTDPAHQLMRRARKLRRPDPTRDAKRERTRKKWLQRNAPALRRRAQLVREKRKALGLD